MGSTRIRGEKRGQREKRGYLDIGFNKVARVTVYNLEYARFWRKSIIYRSECMRKSSLLLYIGNSKVIIICSPGVNKILGDKSFLGKHKYNGY